VVSCPLSSISPRTPSSPIVAADSLRRLPPPKSLTISLCSDRVRTSQEQSMPRTFARRVRLSKLSASMLIPFLAEIGTSVVLSTISRGHADGRMGQKQTSKSECSFSALPPKADVHRRRGHVRFVPKGDLGSVAILGYRWDRPVLGDPAETHGSWSLHAAGGSNAYENREPRRAFVNLSGLRTHEGPVEP
jgi:hypothetical protein